MNGGLHIKQEAMMGAEPQQHHHPHPHGGGGSGGGEQVHHVIKREVVHPEYEEMDQEQQNEGMAEDLTVTSDHTDPGVLDA